MTRDGQWEYDGVAWRAAQRAWSDAEIEQLSDSYETHVIDQALEHGLILILPAIPDAPAPALPPELQEKDRAIGEALDSKGWAVGCLVVVLVAPLAFLLGWRAVNGAVGVVAGLVVACVGLLILGAVFRVTSRRETRARDRLEAAMSAQARESEPAVREEHRRALNRWQDSRDERKRINAAVARAAEEGRPERVFRAEQGRPSLGPGSQRLEQALAAIPGMTRNQRQWLHYSTERVRAVGAAIRDTEAILAVAVGENDHGYHVEFVVVTDSRAIFVKEGKNSQWYWLHQLRQAAASDSLHGEYLEVRTPDGRERLWEVRPPQAAAAIADFLASGGSGALAGIEGTNGELQCPAPLVLGASAVSHGTAKFLGGQFVGNEARARSALHLPLRDGTTVDITLMSNDQICIRHLRTLVGVYDLRDESVLVDEATKLGRGIRRGRLSATGVAALLLGPIALVGVPFSTAQRVRSAFAIAIEDAADYGAFAISDSAFGQQVAMRKRGVGSSSPPSQPEPSVSVLEQLERLAALRESQALSEAEFEELKSALLPDSRTGPAQGGAVPN